MNLVNDRMLNNMRNRDSLTPIELAESRGHSHLATTLTDIIAAYERERDTSEGEIDRLLNDMQKRLEIQTAYLASTHKSIAENLASRARARSRRRPPPQY